MRQEHFFHDVADNNLKPLENILELLHASVRSVMHKNFDISNALHWMPDRPLQCYRVGLPDKSTTETLPLSLHDVVSIWAKFTKDLNLRIILR